MFWTTCTAALCVWCANTEKRENRNKIKLAHLNYSSMQISAVGSALWRWQMLCLEERCWQYIVKCMKFMVGARSGNVHECGGLECELNP